MSGGAVDATALELVKGLAVANVSPRSIAPHVVDRVVPDGFHVEVTDAERFAEVPRRKQARPTFTDVSSFEAYVAAHHLPGRTAVYVGADGNSEAVMDDHATNTEDGLGLPGHADHRALLRLTHTPEWSFWIGRDNVLGDQDDFAEHIEDGIADIVTPDGATMLEVAQSFHAASSTQFKSAKRLRDGNVQFQRIENMTATAGEDGDLEVPTVFVVRVAVFEGEEPVDIQARLRYRVRSGQLSIGYKLDRPDRVLRETTARIRERLADTFDQVYLGNR